MNCAKAVARIIAYTCYLMGVCIIILILLELGFQRWHQVTLSVPVYRDTPPDAGYSSQTE